MAMLHPEGHGGNAAAAGEQELPSAPWHPQEAIAAREPINAWPSPLVTLHRRTPAQAGAPDPHPRAAGDLLAGGAQGTVIYAVLLQSIWF